LSEPAFDELLRRLAEADVEFFVKRVAEVAVDAGGRVQKGDSLLGSAFSIASALASGEQVAIETDLGRLDVIQGLDGVPSYADLRSRASDAEVLGVAVAVCSIDDLKEMKRVAGRTRDLADLEDLDAAGN
jgi:hypothetical protein